MFGFLADNESFNGCFSEDGNIYINVNTADPVIKVVAHEFTHSLQSKAMYDRFKKFVFGVLEGEGQSRRTIIDKKKNSASVYKNYNDTRLEFEMVASFVEEKLLADEKIMHKVVQTEGKAYGTRVHDVLNSIITKLKAHLPWSNKSAVKQYEMLEEGRKMLAEVVRSEDVGIGGEVIYVSAKNNESSSIREQIRANLDILNALQPVVNIDYTIIAKKDLRSVVEEEFKKIGYHVDRQNFGLIEMSEDEIKKSLNYLFTDGEKAALLAVPRVLKRGIEIEKRSKHKGQSYGTVTIAAPITINGSQIGIVGAVVKMTGKNRYRTHRILMPDGSELIFNDNKNDAEFTFSDMRTKNGTQRPDINSASINSISNPNENVKGKMEFSVSAREGSDGEISIKDVEAIRSIPRKSINEFSSEEIAKTEKWARKFYKELGTKSPFFRAWFGDWREHDSSEYNYITATNTEGKNPRGTFTNADTGWNITSSSVGYDETNSHSGKDKLSLRAMQNIDQIIENAVLLDTEVSEYGRGKKSVYTAFMHKFYSVISIDGKMHIAKMSVDESYQPGSDDTNKKFYHVRAIKIEEVPSVGIGESHTPIMEGTPSINSISDLFSLVKQYDSEFKPKLVNKALLNKDGTPKVFYHGTEAKRIRKFKSALNWFSLAKRYAEAFGEKTYSVYLNIKNPLYVGYIDGKIDEDSISRLSKNTGISAETLDEISNELNAKYIYEITNSLQFKKIAENKEYDGLEAVEGGLTSFAVFKPTQIKSATGNIGTFDGKNADIYFSFSSGEEGADGEVKLMPNGEEAPTYEEMHMAPVASAEKMLRGGMKFSEVVKGTGLSLREIALDMESRGENADSIRELTGLYRDSVGGWQFDSAWLDKNVGDLNANREAKIAAAKSAFDFKVMAVPIKEYTMYKGCTIRHTLKFILFLLP